MQQNKFGRHIEILGKMLHARSHDHDDNNSDLELLIIKPEQSLSRSRAAVIIGQGYKFCHCYYETVNDRPVVVFLKKINS